MLGEQTVFKIHGYKVVRELAEGSFGEICEVIKEETQKSYALKALLKSHLIKTDTMKEARLEALLLEVLDHPGVVKLHELREDENYLYLIMQLGGKGDLKDLLSKTTTKQQWRPETKVTLAQILDTIAYLHGRGIVHCDIKPENIVIMNKGNPKMVDFGTARVFDRELLTSDILERWDNFVYEQKTTGSPEYISPEGIKGEAQPARDIWAFGVLAYWFFHGKLPFMGGSHLQIFEKIRDSQPYVQETLNEDAKELIRSCLRKDASSRPTATQLKYCRYFQDVDFKQLFNDKPKQVQKVLLECDVQKKMFFGNYKSRILKVTNQNNELCLSYSYPQTGALKKKIVLQPSDFAQLEEDSECLFFVRTRLQKLHFKTTSKYNTTICVNGINQAIKKFYEL